MSSSTSNSNNSNRRGAVGEITIKTSIRIRPWSQQEREAYPGPSPVQAAPGEVRLFQRTYVPAGSGRSSPTKGSRPATPTSPHATPRAPSSPSLMWRQQAAAQTQLGSEYQSYPFANVFGPEEGNEGVYSGSGCSDVVGAVLGGCNGTIFVYGQTGAGKTHTMDAVTDLVLQQLYAAADDSSSEVAISVSAVELYNEVLRCLLSGRENLQLRWASGAGNVNGVVLEGAEEKPCGSIEEAAALVTMAKASRAVGETRANARSSRSHLIVRIKVEVLQLSSLSGACAPPAPGSPTAAARRASLPSGAAKDGKPPPATVTFSMLNLVDLAGSERIDKTGSADTPLRLREALNINKSLLCLGNVVNALAERAEGKSKQHIPYRDSKLTRLLEDSLGGNATTALVACITPLPDWNLEQSRNTLEFAARAARIVCKPQRNVLSLGPAASPAPGDAANIIASLEAEVAALKKQLSDQQQLASPSPSPLQPQLHALSVQPVSSSTTLWNSCSRSSAVLAGVAECAVEAEGDSSKPTASSCPSSPTGRHSRGRPAWTTRLRISLGGSNPASVSDGTGVEPSSHKLFGSRSFHHFPSRIPSPKHHSSQQVLPPGALSPHASGRGEGWPPVAGIERSVSDDTAAVSRKAAGGARQPGGLLTHPAQPPSAAAAAAGGVGASSDAGAGQALPPSAHTTSIVSRASGTQKSVLWKLLQQPHGHDRHHSGHQAAGSIADHISSSTHSGQPASLKSTGLLITSSGNAASAAAAVAANAVGAFARWATFSGGRSSLVGGGATASGASHETQDSLAAHPVQLSPQGSSLLHTHTTRSSIASRRLTTDGVSTFTGRNSALLASSSTNGLATGKGGLDSSAVAAETRGSICAGQLDSRVAAAEAAMALRDHIIKQLVLALQQKKAEIRSLKEQLASVLKQLESCEHEEESNKGKLRELAEGIQMLAAARQAEFEKWKGHLVGLEAALQTAQKEASNYRDESQSLVQQLTELQARYDSLQTEQRHSLINAVAAPVPAAAEAAKSAEQEQQFLECIKRLQAIEAALQQMLHLKPETVNGSRPGSPSPTSRSRAVTPRIRQLLPPPDEEAQQLLPKLPLEQLQEQDQEQQGEAEGGLTVGPLIAAWPPGNRQHDNTSCEVTSHQIQTVTTRLFDGSSRLTTGLTTAAGGAGGGAGDFTNSLAQAAEAAATAAKLSHVEFVLVELQELMPLVKAAAQAAAHGFVGSSGSSTGGAGAAPGHVLASRGMQLSHPGVLQHSSSGIADNTEDKQQDQTLHTKEAKASFVGGAGLIPAAKCHKCDSLKPLLVIMQKLKDEVVLLKAAVRMRDTKLGAAEESAAEMKADLVESQQQVDALRERIEELSEDLELARSAAAAAAAAAAGMQAAAAAAAAAAASSGGSASTQGGASGSAAAATSAGGTCGEQQQLAALKVAVVIHDGEGEDGGVHAEPQSPGRELSQREVVAGRTVPLMGEDTPLEALHAQILQSWQALAMPFSYRCAFVLGTNSANSSSSSRADCAAADNSSSGDGSTPSTTADAAADAPQTAAAAAASQGVHQQAPWSDRAQCQAHIALLACLHQYHEDEPAAAEQQWEVLADEGRVIEAGLALLPAEQLAQLLQHWGVSSQPTSDSSDSTAAAAAACRAELRSKLWLPSTSSGSGSSGSRVSAEVLAADSAAACQLALRAAPPTQLAAVSLRCNASVLAAASNALADAAS